MIVFVVLLDFVCAGIFAVLPFISIPFPIIAPHHSMTTFYIQVCTRKEEITMG